MYKELMQVNTIKEEEYLSNLLQDIVPAKEEKFTNLEIELNKTEEFSLVVYKKETIFKRLAKNIKQAIEKFRIMKYSINGNYLESKVSNK